jgi:dolichyl-phosphate beta-glucosyltransferase
VFLRGKGMMVHIGNINDGEGPIPKKKYPYGTFVKYSIVGVFVTGVDFAVFSIAYYISLLTPVTSKIIAFSVAVLASYALNRLWTFRSTESKISKQLGKFLVVSIVGLGLSVSLIYVLIVSAGWHPLVSNGITSAIVLGWNFLANKYWTFRITRRRNFEEEIPSRDLSLVIPAFNEEHRIGKTLMENVEFFRRQNFDWEMIIVDDGSMDNTCRIVQEWATRDPDKIRLLRLPRNRGKGSAVQLGVMNATGKYIVMADADNATPIEEVARFYKEAHDGRILIGSRYLESSVIEIKQSKFRIYMGRIGNILINVFLLEGIRDTQCGFKMFPMRIAKDLFSRQRISGWGFDMEILAIAQGLGIPIEEKGVTWRDVGGSRLRPIRAAIYTFLELVKIKMNVWSGAYE